MAYRKRSTWNIYQIFEFCRKIALNPQKACLNVRIYIVAPYLKIKPVMQKKSALNRWTWGVLTTIILAMGLGTTSCEKDIRDSEKVDIIIPYYVKTFGLGNYLEEDYRHSEAMTDDSLRKCADHPYVRRIFIAIPFDHEDGFEDGLCFTYARIRTMCLELSKKMAISPKISGRGNFRFHPGNCSEQDSLSFVAMGFTVNQQGILYNFDHL